MNENNFWYGDPREEPSFVQVPSSYPCEELLHIQQYKDGCTVSIPTHRWEGKTLSLPSAKPMSKIHIHLGQKVHIHPLSTSSALQFLILLIWLFLLKISSIIFVEGGGSPEWVCIIVIGFCNWEEGPPSLFCVSVWHGLFFIPSLL